MMYLIDESGNKIPVLFQNQGQQSNIEAGDLGTVDSYTDSASTTSTSLVELYRYTPPQGTNARIIGMSFTPDSVFAAHGKFQIVIEGKPEFRQTAPSSSTLGQPTPKPLTAPLDIDFSPKGFILHDGLSMVIQAVSDNVANTVTLGFEVHGFLQKKS